jgi:hypothetical protein
MSEEALMISIKNGDIKCDVGEVRFLLYIVEQMNQLINKYAVGEDNEKIKKFIEYYEYFKDKYLVLQEVRNQENFYFNQMKAWQKKLNESSDENMKKLILESANEYQTKYKKLKKKRECLCKELEKLKKKNIVIYRLLYRYGEEMDIKKNWRNFNGVWNDLDYIEADNIYVPKKKYF